jgi:glycerate 2-kinase
VLVAPDSFKGTFTAPEAAVALGAGAVDTGCRVDLCPVADGGEGTMAVLLEQVGGVRRQARVHAPLGNVVSASFALLDHADVAVVETAEASGLGLVPESLRDPERASTYGTGELIAAAVDAGAREIVVAVGGSATTDGGVGALDAIEDAGGLAGARVRVLCDVTTPFEDAALVYGPQKGADQHTCERLTARLHSIAERLPRDPRTRPMTGCAGGLSGALWAAHDATLEGGAASVLTAVGFDARLTGADAVIVGEGRLDGQSLQGKIVGEILQRAVLAGVPVHAVVGRNELSRAVQRGFASVIEARTLPELRLAGGRIAKKIMTAAPLH